MKDRYCPSPFERRQQATDDRLAMQARSEEIARSLLQTPQDTVEIPNITALTGRRRKRVGVGGMVLATTALALAAACGGEKGEVKGVAITSIPNTPAATEPLPLSPTIIPTIKPTETPKPINTEELKREIVTLVEKGFTGINPSYEEVPDVSYHSAEGLLAHLNNCLVEGQLRVGTHVVNRGEPNWANAVLAECQSFGKGTGTLYQVTGEPSFYEANQLGRDLYLTRVEQVRSEIPGGGVNVDDTTKKVIKEIFTLEPPK